MNLKIIKPCTPAKRHVIQFKTNYSKNAPLLKNNIKGKKNSNGRNNSGRITVRHKGGGHKTKYRLLNFTRNTESTGIIVSKEYDPNRTAQIASVFDLNHKKFFYIILPKNLKVGDIIKSGSNLEPRLGYSLPIGEIPIGSFIHNVFLAPEKHSQLSRSAGTFSQVKETTMIYSKIKLSSSKDIKVNNNCYATIGVVSNELKLLIKLGKAGRSRWLNNRPTVRGVAMNPVDHPHGGGEGKKSGKGKTPWGKPVKKGKIRTTNK